MTARADADVSDASFGEQFRSLPAAYWLANAMEMLERFGYYGLRTVLPIYMVLAVEQDGPQFDHVQKGTILAWWAIVQSFVPILSGGYADRYGYRLTVGVSIAIKVAGYLVMGWATDIAFFVTAGVSATVPGHPATYAAFLTGALLLALGTAVFKPGIQGLVAQHVTDRNASVAWSFFYQVVNVGGFLGPFLAGVMRLMAWKWVFVSCAAIVALNYLLLLGAKDPEARKDEGPQRSFWKVLDDSGSGILEPRLFAFLAVFSGFWAMFYQLFDLLPNFIEDWVDSRSLHDAVVAPLFALFGSTSPAEWGGHVPQEYLININAGLIMAFASVVGLFTGRVRSMTAMILGVVVAAGGIFALGQGVSGWWIAGSVAVFSLGEMMASPTKIRYFATIAPPGQKGLYLGYVNATTGIGWSLGSIIAGALYQEGGDKVVLARRMLVESQGVAPDLVAALPKTDVLPLLAERLGLDAHGVTSLLWNTYSPGGIWTWFTVVGLVSMVGLVLFDQITQRAGEWEEVLLIVLTGSVMAICYDPWIGAAAAGVMAARRLVGSRWAWRGLAVLGIARMIWIAGAAWAAA